MFLHPQIPDFQILSYHNKPYINGKLMYTAFRCCIHLKIRKNDPCDWCCGPYDMSHNQTDCIDDIGCVCVSTDETASENILKAELSMASLCGRLGLVTPRDAFITAICKASLPPHYALTILSSNTSLSNKGTRALHADVHVKSSR